MNELPHLYVKWMVSETDDELQIVSEDGYHKILLVCHNESWISPEYRDIAKHVVKLHNNCIDRAANVKAGVVNRLLNHILLAAVRPYCWIVGHKLFIPDPGNAAMSLGYTVCTRCGADNLPYQINHEWERATAAALDKTGTTLKHR